MDGLALATSGRQDERLQLLESCTAAVSAGRAWADDKWRAFRAHPCWSHMMQAWVARRHYWRMLPSEDAHANPIRAIQECDDPTGNITCTFIDTEMMTTTSPMGPGC